MRLTVVICLLLASACSTQSPTSNEASVPVAQRTEREQTEQAPVAAKADPLASAIVSAANSDAALRTRLNSLALQTDGALATQDVGYYMDIQTARLRQQIQTAGVSIERQGNGIALTIPGSITFETGKSSLDPAILPVLTAIAEVLSEYSKTLIAVLGHTDSSGNEDYNQRLSEQRGLAFARYLVRQGVATQRILITGLGETRPIADNDTTDGKALNRRIELHIEPVVR